MSDLRSVQEEDFLGQATGPDAANPAVRPTGDRELVSPRKTQPPARSTTAHRESRGPYTSAPPPAALCDFPQRPAESYCGRRDTPASEPETGTQPVRGRRARPQPPRDARRSVERGRPPDSCGARHTRTARECSWHSNGVDHRQRGPAIAVEDLKQTRRGQKSEFHAGRRQLLGSTGGAPDGLPARSERTLAPPPRSPSKHQSPG